MLGKDIHITQNKIKLVFLYKIKKKKRLQGKKHHKVEKDDISILKLYAYNKIPLIFKQKNK